MQSLNPLRIAVGEGIVKYQRQAAVVGRCQYLRHRQSQGRRQLFAHAATEPFKGVALLGLLQLQIVKS